MKQRTHTSALITRFYLLIAVMLNAAPAIAQGYAKNGVVEYAIHAPVQIKQGTVFHIDVHFKVKPEWYIYAPDGANAAQGMIETKVVFDPADGISKVGRIELPDPGFKDGHRIYQGDSIVMRQAFNAATPGRYEIKGKVIYQSCNSRICLPPESEEILVPLQIK